MICRFVPYVDVRKEADSANAFFGDTDSQRELVALCQSGKMCGTIRQNI
jgi:hypothetical protein